MNMGIISQVPSSVKSAELAIERRLGWLVYAEGMPAEVCGTSAMVAGWFQALRDQANADAWSGDYSDALPVGQRDEYVGA